MKPTYLDIARKAGVGTATVERVLNGRGGVREATAEAVVLAARSLDWPGRLPDRHRGIVRIEVVLVGPETSFYSRMARAFRRIAASLDRIVQVQVTFVDERAPARIAAHLADRSLRRSGLVIASPDHPAVRAALGALRQRGVPVVQIVTRTVEDAAFVGIDNNAAGRMAAMFLARMGPASGPVAALSHSQVYAVHRERVRGFSDYLAEHAPHLRFVWLGFGHDNREDSAARLREGLRQWPDLVGFYNAGGGNTGVLAALRASGRRVFFVGHELNELTAEALRDGTADVILDQLPEAQARRSLDLLLSAIGLIADPVENPPIRFTTVTAENL